MQKKIVLLALLTFFSFRISAQDEKNYVTDKVSKKYAYVNVIATYERVAAKGYKSVELFQKLGNSSYSDCKLEKAAIWYGELFALTSDLDPVYYYRYADALQFICQNEKADAILAKLKLKPKGS
ncbi:flagellar motor protein MotB [Flavobacterium sp. JAS]|uniref:flagellar motor protein MotB n=1 Tax=Flavobacterium sp. JAS TaxID=2897329 RepID=UPI001E494A5B|nr:flagellar motor protein MotB [Flavobacterium sp. JAS]MCD0472379.1 flagellar motor protein MotB [Flavobacterium sp. JAS]